MRKDIKAEAGGPHAEEAEGPHFRQNPFLPVKVLRHIPAYVSLWLPGVVMNLTYDERKPFESYLRFEGRGWQANNEGPLDLFRPTAYVSPALSIPGFP